MTTLEHMICPHCKKPISAKLVRSAAAKLNRARQATPNPKKLSPCPHCGKPKGVAELRLHKPQCPKNPRNMRAKQI